MLKNVKNDLDNVGCGFCLAKWTQVTMHLNNGLTHSCHHPSPHKISLRELDNNHTALHNSRFKKKQRRDMLRGKKPKECNYCWKIEENSNSFSDRIFKSSEPWSLPYFDEIKNLSWDNDYNPKYVEVNFSNVCNLKCAYCGPIFSSKWVEEMKMFGAYPTSTNFNDLDWIEKNDQMPFDNDDDNPYVNAFWEWWPELYDNLHTFRITGGEPLLSKDTWKILDFILETKTPNRNLNLSINTNLSVSKDIIKKLVDKCKKIIDNDLVNELIIFTSCESWGEQSEYLRYGMNFNEFMKNIEFILQELPKVTVNIMATFNVMSPFGYDKLIDKVFELKKEYKNDQRYWTSAVQLDTSYVRWPKHLSVKILDDEHKKMILDSAKKAFYYATLEFNHKNYGFSNTEVQKIKRLYDYSMSNDNSFDVNLNRNDFVKFIDEYDKRRGTNFIKVFPELKRMYENVKNK